MNLNRLAIEVAKREGKKKQVDIAQIKEIIKIVIKILNEKEEKPKSSTRKKTSKTGGDGAGNG